MKDTMLEFMAGQMLCVISTVTPDSKSESALVGFSNTANLELIIGTSNQSRKYSNIVKNPAVSVVIGDLTAEVQYEGTAEEVDSNEYKVLIEEKHMEKLPGAAKYRDDPNQVYLKISPTWIRFIKHGKADAVEEFTEFSK